MAAARLADVGAADPQPAVLRRGGDHRGEQPAVGGLHGVALGERAARVGDTVGERVANLLQLTQAERPRRPRGRDPVRDVDPAEPRGDQPRELQLEPADLPPQLTPRTPLLDPDPLDTRFPMGNKRRRPARLSVEQIRHGLILSRLEGRGGDPERLVDGDRGDGADPDRGNRDAPAVALHRPPRRGGAE